MPNVFKGIVSGLQQRVESVRGVSNFVWDFRLERKDDKGEALPRTAVQVRGRTLVGNIANGDHVEVTGATVNGVLRTSRVQNLSSNATVIAQGEPAINRVGRVLRVIYIIIFFIIFFLAAKFVLTGQAWLG